VWKFQNLSVIHILREINIKDPRISKTAIFAVFEVLNSVLAIFSIQKLQNIMKNAENFSTKALVVKFVQFAN